MPTVKLSPVFQDQQFNDNGDPLVGGKLYWYLAGSTTPATTYKDSAGTIAHSNPVILNSTGRLDSPIWLESGKSYKVIIKDSLDNSIGTPYDNLTGINDTAIATVSEWLLYPAAATFLSATSISITGDATQILTVGRRIRAAVSNGTGTAYSTILTSVFSTGVTTLTVQNDSGAVLDATVSSIYYGILDPSHPSIKIFASGTKTVFVQAAPPAGWTLDTALNNRNLRIVNTAGGGTGGLHSPILLDGTTVPSHTHTFTTGIESSTHTHSFNNGATQAWTVGGTGATIAFPNAGAAVSSATLTTESANHTHSGTTAANTSATNWQPFYVDAIVCIAP